MERSALLGRLPAIHSALPVDAKQTRCVHYNPACYFSRESNSGDCSDTILGNKLIPILTSLSQKTGAGLIELYSITKDHPEWYGDGLHLGRTGNETIAQEIYAAVNAQ